MNFKKTIMSVLSLIVILSFSACNLPGSGNVDSPTPEINQVATQVAMILTATNSANSLTPISATDAVVIPSSADTALPALTSTSTQTPTLTPTQLATATAPLTIQPSPTLLSSDPKANLGKPVWSTDFANGKTFGLDTPVDDPEYHFEVKNGEMVMIGKKPDGFHAWRLASYKIQNFYVEAAFQTSDCSGLDRYGLIFRSPDNNKGYFLGISCDGQYGLRVYDGDTFSDLVKWTKSDFIHAGANQSNLVGVMAKDTKLTLYVNGQSLGDVSDSSYQQGVFGYFISSTNTTNLTVQSNSIGYWAVP
jgi:hypothetical protein